MLAPFRPPNKKRLRMDLTLQVDGKEKSPTKSLLKRIGNSFRSPFSKKKEADPPQLTDDDSYSEEGEYVDDVDVAQPPSDGPQFSHEEERLAFLAKGKSLLNTPRPIRNLIGDSATWRQDDWSTTVGKSLPRTPVDKPKVYPDLSAITETGEPASVGVPLLPAPSIPEKRKRAKRVKHQLPVRHSERLKAQACRNTEIVKDATTTDNYLNIVKESENEEDEEDDDFESTKSHLESDTEENDKIIEERVEAELKQKEIVTQPATSHQQNSLPFSSTPVNKTQNLYTASVPLPKVEPAALPARPTKTQPLSPASNTQTIASTQSIPPVNTQPLPSSSNTQTIASTLSIPPNNPPLQPSSTTPFRQAITVTLPAPFQSTSANSQLLAPILPTKPILKSTTMSSPTPYEALYKCLRTSGLSREDAAAGAKAALAVTKPPPPPFPAPTTPTVGNLVDCSTISNQSYYNSQKLLQNQQQQTIALLAQVPAFNGMGSTKFEDWIQHFERVVDTAEFEEGRKIKLLGSKLFGSAGDCITTFQLNYPREAKSFLKVKQNLHERFHGGDNRKMYFTEFKNCIRNSGESIRDYACRLQKLYSFAYPTEEGKPIDPAVLQLRETMLMDGFLGGLKSNLRERMSFKDYKNLNDLVKATEKCAAVLSEAKLEKRSVEFVNAISANANAHELRETKNEISELKSVIEQLAQKLATTTLGGNNKEAVNVIAATQATQITESRGEIEELKNLLKASNKSYHEMVKQSRDAEKAMKTLQLQVAGMSQPSLPTQLAKQFQPNHSSQFVDPHASLAHQPVAYRPPQQPYNYGPPNQAHGPPPRIERYCILCASNGRNPTTHNTDKCGWGPNGPTCFKCHQSGHLARDCPSLQPRSDNRYAPPGPNGGQQNPWNREN